ncbi:MAG TPA: MMPL family transporter, partial [Solirubrobacteraceae bacterium]|nr:MMPL family transporter [Solirubrobacteraceae bacterium]
MAPLTRWVLAHKRMIVIFWVLITLIGVASAGSATKALKQKFSVPGKEGWVTNQQIARDFHGTGGNSAPLMPIVTLPAGKSVDSPSVQAGLRAVEARLERVLPGGRVASYASTHNRAFVSKDGRTTFIVDYPRPDPNQPFGDNPKAAEKATAALEGTTVAGAPVHVTGFDALSVQSGGGNGPGVLVEALLGGFGALLVLAFVFASFLAVVPIMMAIVSILTTFLVVWGLTTVTEVSPIVQFLVALIGLGVSIDYALIVVVRWREERSHGLQGDEAIVRAMATAGRAVVFSGTTVAIGLLALVALPLPFLRSVGYGGMLIPLISVIVAVTLLPVVLSKFGARLDWPHVRDDDKASRSWTGWANLVVRRRWLAAVGAALVLAALVLAASNLQLGLSNANAIARQGDAKQGLLALERSGIGSGALLPNEVLVEGSTSPDGVAKSLAAVPEVHGAVAPNSPQWRRAGAAVVDAFAIPDGSSASGRDVLDRVRSAAHEAGSEVRLGGLAAQNEDFINAVYGNFPLMIALIALITFVLLARAFRSLLLPLKAVILNVISVGAAWGVLDLIWQRGHGSDLIWGISATGSITAWIPLMVFAFLFGLSMDYEVFILARMREEYDATGSTDTAVVRGIGRTGRLVTSAALILFLAFLSLASGPETEIKVLATGLAAGILLDATIIRALLVP